LALLSSDVERTISFYQDVLEFPLTDLFENRDYPGSTHFFFVEIDFEHETSVYFRGPDGERLELLAENLGEMYGSQVL